MFAGAALVLLPGIPLLQFIFYAQVVQGILLPPELILMLLIVNKTAVMGKYTNSATANVIGWATVAIIGSLAVAYTVQQIFFGGA